MTTDTVSQSKMCEQNSELEDTLDRPYKYNSQYNTVRKIYKLKKKINYTNC